MTSFNLRSLLAILLLPATLAHSAEGEPAAVLPYRPSLSTPAQLPVPGQLELEFGGLHSKTGSVQRDSLPYQFKLAFNPQWGILLNGEAVVSTRDSGTNDGRISGVGDTNLVLKRAFIVDDATAFGLELGVKLPTARDNIGSGRADYIVNTIFSRDLGSVHMDANLNFTRVGLVDAGTGSVQTGLSFAFSHAVTEQFTVTGELSGNRRSATPSTAQALVALSYSPTKQLTFDIGISHGLNAASLNYALFAGVVIPVARLF